jgi:hypothetical protein
VGELQLEMVMRVALLVQDGLGPVPRTQLSSNFSPFSSSTKDSAEQLPAKSGFWLSSFSPVPAAQGGS